ncbi:MAG: serine/threonine protein kinase [Burkholderiaceae bacterium]
MPEALTQNLKLIGRYSILRELRRDRHTVAYLAMDPVLNRELVLKAVQLQPKRGEESAGHERIEQAFMRQAQAAGRLHHPHIVTVFDAGRVHKIGFLALERVDGKLLDEALHDGFRPGVLQAADIAARVADAIEHAHSRGVPHGHLAPSRIYLQEPDKVPKVMGFGGWIDSGTTGDFELAGTQSMLPYFQNELGPEARRKDIRALGALLFLLLTGTRPDLNALRARKSGESPIIEIRPAAPLALAEIAESALELHGARPFGTAAQVRNALTTFLWGNRGNQPSNALTITGMPARVEIVPTAQIRVATVGMQSTMRVNRQAPLRARSPMALAVAACVIALMAAFGAAWHGASALSAAPPSAKGETQGPFIQRAVTDSAAPVAAQAPDSSSGASAVQAQGASQGPNARANNSRPTKATVPGEKGLVVFAVAPWGEVFVNGAREGTTPPLAQLQLPAGRHTIELRNGQRQPYVAQIDVTPGRPLRISHLFQ